MLSQSQTAHTLESDAGSDSEMSVVEVPDLETAPTAASLHKQVNCHDPAPGGKKQPKTISQDVLDILEGHRCIRRALLDALNDQTYQPPNARQFPELCCSYCQSESRRLAGVPWALDTPPIANHTGTARLRFRAQETLLQWRQQQAQESTILEIRNYPEYILPDAIIKHMSRRFAACTPDEIRSTYAYWPICRQYANEISSLITAAAFGTEGNSALDKAWAEHSRSKGQKPLTSEEIVQNERNKRRQQYTSANVSVDTSDSRTVTPQAGSHPSLVHEPNSIPFASSSRFAVSKEDSVTAPPSSSFSLPSPQTSNLQPIPSGPTKRRQSQLVISPRKDGGKRSPSLTALAANTTPPSWLTSGRRGFKPSAKVRASSFGAEDTL